MNTIILLLTMLLSPVKTCMATVYGFNGDKMMGGKNRCTNQYTKVNEKVIAHRNLPCGTKVFITNNRTKKSSIAVVVDRGPYGATFNNQWILKRSNKDPGIWRGCVDMSKALADEIEHNGFEKISFVVFHEGL